jgi:dimethylglycine dehydrogenase
MLRDHAGIIDISNFAKYRVAGAGAETWLNALFANRMPKVVGKSCLTPLIGKRGGIAGDFTVTRLGPDEFWVIGSGIAERYHRRFFNAVPLPEGTTFESMTVAMCGFNVAGPKSRELLQRLTNTSLATADFPFMASQRIELAGVDCLALRVSFTGDLGWELHCAEADQARLYTALLEAGKPLGAGPVGGRALMSLRVEKGYGSWSREYSPEYWPQEVGLDRLCKMDKDFLNKSAVAGVLDRAPREHMVLLALDEADVSASNADATGGEPIFKDGVGVGRVTSGTYGYSVGMSLALGYVKAGQAAPGDAVEVMVLGRPHRARILHEPPFDPTGARLRA